MAKTKVTPEINFDLSDTESSPVVGRVDGEDVRGEQKVRSMGGRLGFRADTEGMSYGAGVSGGTAKGQLDLPSVLEQFGAPDKVKFGSGKIKPQDYDAFLEMADIFGIKGATARVEAGYTPSDYEKDKKRIALKLKYKFAKGGVAMKEMDDYLMGKTMDEPQNFAEGGMSVAKQMEMFEDGGLLQEGGTVDPVSGNDVPPGSTQEEVRDDIPAQLSEGEFVFPADVVRFIGLGTLMRIRQEAKMGLKQMDAMGQMGNSDEATMPDDLPFDLNDLDIEDEDEYNGRQEFAVGGTPTPNPDTGVYYTPSAGQGTTGVTAPQPVQAASSTYKAPQQYTPPTVTTPTPDASTFFLPPEGMAPETREYINSETGEKKIITFVNGQPTTEIPEGFVPASEYVKPEKTTTDTTRLLQPKEEGAGEEGASDPSSISTSTAKAGALSVLDVTGVVKAAVEKVNKQYPKGGIKPIPLAVVDGIKRKIAIDDIIDDFNIEDAAKSAGLSVEDYEGVVNTLVSEVKSGYRDKDGIITAESVAKGPKDVSDGQGSSDEQTGSDEGDGDVGGLTDTGPGGTGQDVGVDDSTNFSTGYSDEGYNRGGSVSKQMKRSGLASK